MKSIGQVLKTARQKKNFTIEDIYKFIKVHPKYLRALESDDYSVFDGRVHSKGFLKIYAEFLELDTNEVLALWRREYESYFERKPSERFNKLKSVEPEKFVITPAVAVSVFFSLLLVSFFIYLFVQYRQFTGAPALDIYYPEDNQVLDHDVLDLTGKTELDSEIFINNQKILTNPDGTFLTSIKLREGINNISVKAVNTLGKETEKLRTIIYRPIRLDLYVNESTPSVPQEEEVIVEPLVDE